nr:diaminopimelate decarboxylase [uncultured Anaeromusa sp.]
MAGFEKMIVKSKNEYRVQNQLLRSLGDTFETPFYLYDLDLIEEQYKSLYQYIPWPTLKIHYAMKANYNKDILLRLREANAGIDAVSPAEVLLALSLGFKPETIIFTANHMTDVDMHLVKAQKVLLNVDSLFRLERYAECYPGSEVSLRFNPDVVAGENEKVQTGGKAAKFGLLLEEASQAATIAHKYNLQVVGVHMHVGSGIADTEVVYQGIKNVLKIATRERFSKLRFIDFGGGFKVKYHPDEPEVNYEDFGKKITDLFAAYCHEYGKELELYFEPGKYIVAEAGCLIMQVNTVREANGRVIVGTDAGFPQCIRPVFYGAHHPIINISNPTAALCEYDVYGNTCESGDCFAKQRLLPEVKVGDYLGILNAGAYCFSMASVYNLRPLPLRLSCSKEL